MVGASLALGLAVGAWTSLAVMAFAAGAYERERHQREAFLSTSAMLAQAGQRKLTDMPKGTKPPLDAGEIEYLNDSLALSMAQKGMSMRLR